MIKSFTCYFLVVVSPWAGDLIPWYFSPLNCKIGSATLPTQSVVSDTCKAYRTVTCIHMCYTKGKLLLLLSSSS